MAIAEAPKVQQRYSEVTFKQSSFLRTMNASARGCEVATYSVRQ